MRSPCNFRITHLPHGDRLSGTHDNLFSGRDTSQTMLTRRLPFAFAVFAAGLLAILAKAEGGPPEYRLGDIASADVVSPTTLRVVNPDLSEELKRESAAQVPLVFRQLITAPDEAARELRASVELARTEFLAALRPVSEGAMPDSRQVDSPAFAQAIEEANFADPHGPPLARLAPLWISGASDAPVVDALLGPVREVMSQAIAGDNPADPLSLDQPIRIIPVKSRLEGPGLAEMETSGVITQAANLSSVEMARSVVMSYFPSDEQATAQFAARFIRANTFAAPGLTELLRSQRRDAAAAYNTCTAGQVIVRKGQTIDGKALAALAALREKNQIDALLTKVDSKPSVASSVITDTGEFAMWAGAVGLLLLLILWRWGGPKVAAGPAQSAVELAVDAEADGWRNRALLAEQRAERAHEAIRQGALGWMKEKVFRSAVHQRADLLANQQLAEAEMRELEQRMSRLLVPLQDRIKAYEERIKELEAALADQKDDDRRLIDARISRDRQQLELERARAGQDF